MFKALSFKLLILYLLFSVSAAESGYQRCNCDDEGSWWRIESILECQRVSDFLIAVAYFSIPIELLYFVSCSNVPFKWVLVQFIAFIVLCGLTHLLNGWTYGSHPFQLMLSLTIFKILTAFVSCATSITLITLIPLLLKVKLREFMLKKKTWDLGREVGMMMKQKEAGMHVRMLTQEIRKSLDRHTILYTTLFELSETLGLQYCAVWMPNENRTEMILTHELKGRNYSNLCNFTIPISDPDVVRIKASDEMNILGQDSTLVSASKDLGEPGLVASIRMPMLRVSNLKGGTPESVQTCYAILVLVLPGGQPRTWTRHEVELIKVVADQVAVALSHAGLLEESQLMWEKLAEQNRALQQARMGAMLASKARNSFQKVTSDGMRRPMHSILGLLSMLQDENLKNEQQVIVDTMVRTCNVLSTLINDVMDNSAQDSGRFPLEIRTFSMHAIIREAACLAKCLCVYKGFSFAVEVERSLPDYVMGDERRVFQVILHMVGNLLNKNTCGKLVILWVSPEKGSQGRNDLRWATWRQDNHDGGAYIKFVIRMGNSGSQSDGSRLTVQHGRRYKSDGVEEALSFSICKKLAQLMHGNIWEVSNPQGSAHSMELVFRCQLRSSIAISITESEESSEHPNSNSLFHGLQVILVDGDDLNRAVTKKLIEKLGFQVTALSSGFECLTAITPPGSAVQVIFLDLHMPDLDGFEIATKIRKFRSRNCPLIIALTASADDDIWEKCMQIGVNGLIRKPVLMQGIADELQRVLLHTNRIVR